MAAHAARIVGAKAIGDGEHDQVAGLSVHLGAQGGHLLVRKELHDGAVDGAVLAEGDPSQALGAKLGGDAGELVDFGARPGAGTLGVERLDVLAIGIGSAGEELEGRVGKDVRHVMEFHAVAGIGLVGAIGVHGVPVLHATQRAGQLDTHLGEGVAEHIL